MSYASVTPRPAFSLSLSARHFFSASHWFARVVLVGVALLGAARSARADDCAGLYNSQTGASGYFATPSLTAGETLDVQISPGANGTFKIQNAAHTTTYASYTSTSSSKTSTYSYLVPSTGTYALYYSGNDSSYTVGCGYPSPASGTITTVSAYAVTAPSAYNFGSVILPASATKTLTFTIPAGGSETIASVAVVTMGAPNLDFTESGADTCTGKSLATASTCTVTVQFLPLRAGWRKGGVLLKGSTGNILSAAYVQGIGTGAQLAYSYGAPVTYASVPKTNVQGSSGGTRLAVDGNGMLYLPSPPVSAGDLEYYSFPSPYTGTAPTPTLKATGLNYPGYDTETGQNYSAGYDSNAIAGMSVAAVDGVGNIYITGVACDCDGDISDGIMRVDPAGNSTIFYAYTVPDTGTTPIGLPQALAVGGDGTVYVFSSKYNSADTNAGINAFNPYTAAFTHSAISGLSFLQPYSAAIDSTGNLYVADGNYQSPSPTVYKISGTSYSVLNIGTTLATHTSYISSIAIDSLDNLFLANAGSNTAVSNQIFVVPVSNPSSPTTISSVASTTFKVIGSLAFDAQDNLYVQDVSVYNASNSTARSIYYFPLQTPALSFAAQAKGTSSAPQTLTLTNIGNAPLSITVPSSGSNPSVSSSFTLTANSDTNACVASSSVTIPAASICARFGTCSSTTADSCTIKVASSPHVSSGATSGAVTLASNLSATESSVALTGVGAPGLVSFSFTGLPASTPEAAFETTTVTALDGGNATLTGYTGTVHFSLANTDVAASLPSDYTFTGSENGTKTFQVALSTPQAQTVIVTDSADSVFASQSTTVTAVAGPVAAVHAYSGGGQSATISSSFANPLVVQTTDASGNPVGGVTVTFAAPSSGQSATFSASSCVTSASATPAGSCSVTATANATTGAYSVTASVAGITGNATFALTNTAVVTGPQAAGVFGGSLTPNVTYTNIFNAQMNATNSIVVGDQTSSTSFPFDVLRITGSGYANTQVTRLTVNYFNGASIDDAGDLTYCYQNSGSTRINTRISNGSGGYTPTYNVYLNGGNTARCTSANDGTIYHAPGDGTLNVAVPSGSGFNVTAVSGTPSGIAGVAMGYNGNLLLAATGGTYIGTVTSGAWTGTLVTTRQFYNYAAYQDGSGKIYLEDASAQNGYQYTLNGATYTESSWSKPFGVTANSYSYNISGTLMAAASTSVQLQFASSLTFPPVAVGSSDPVEELIFKFTAPGTLGGVTVQAPGGSTDFADAGTGTCATNGSAFTYAVGDICTVDVRFTPTRGGARTGTLTGKDASNNVLATAPLSGTGVGATVNHLAFTAIPTAAQRGASFSVTATAYSDSGTTVATFVNGTTATVTSSDSAATLPTGVTFVNGVATFNITLNTAGSKTISVADAAGSATVTSSGISVTTLDHFAFTAAPPATTTAGTSFNVTVTAYADSGTTVATSYTGPLAFTSTDANAVFPTGTALNMTAGVGTYAVTLKTAGTQTITVADAGGSPSKTSGNIAVSAGAAAVVVASTGSGQIAIVGNAFANALVVQTTDAYGNPVGGVTVSFTAPATGASATFSAASCVTSATATPAGSCSVTATANATVGSSYSVTASSGSLTSATFTLTNSAKTAQTITFTQPGSQNFGTTPTLTASSTSGLTVTFTSSTTSVCTITTGGALTFLTSGTCTINADQAGNGTYAAATTLTHSFTVNAVVPGAPAIGTATAANQQATVTFTAPTNTGGAGITTYTVTSSPGAKTGTGTGSPITVTGLTNGTAYTFTVTATNSAGPGAASASSNSVTPSGVQTITFTNPGTQTYGTTPQLSASSTSGLTVTFTSTTTGVCTVTSGGLLSFVMTGTCSINADQAGNSTYNAATTVTQSFTVQAAAQTITFTQPASPVIYGVSPITLTATGGASGNAVTFSIISGPGIVSGTTLTVTGAGTIVVAADQSGNSNYSVATEVQRSIVVSAALQTITFTQPTSPVTYGVSPISLTATGGASGNAVTFSVISGPGTVSGSTLTVTGAGTIVVAADQAATTNYSAATEIQRSIVVNAASQTITFTQPSTPITYGSATTVALSATGGASGNAVTFTVASGPGTISGSTLTITGAGTIVINANQTASANYAAATQVSG